MEEAIEVVEYTLPGANEKGTVSLGGPLGRRARVLKALDYTFQARVDRDRGAVVIALARPDAAPLAEVDVPPLCLGPATRELIRQAYASIFTHPLPPEVC
jgi:hypothetical protein